ncbi:MAG: SusD/RagB family nutrient-binding outer membrane lipoprotein [Prevotella bivia]|uniref:SusD/RagB family nutrient-binding outer membrane lipoprotein n=1 Tax=Prevotella bivia TaxID=28125 RepID=UPI00254CA615|nr:SusD/RagB family nutrient-binding outer membrane lipoprotein [Prevotella bivia]MDU7314778.1 SusD/RagB family nutrient-binding outer membrane lipoprotein [Prevotella bivia]WIL17415.1 SusD/RagB family nutrient-binding outer membrane lipoprotein [Prevotella bivia]
MRKSFKLTILAACVLGLAGCGDFGDINSSPNNISVPDTRYLLLGAEQYGGYFNWSDNYNPYAALYAQYISERKNVQQTKFGILNGTSSTIYRIAMQNCVSIINMNKDPAQKNLSSVKNLSSSNKNQIAVATTLKAFYMMHLADTYGSMPYSDAFKAKSEGNTKPKYDTVKDIYTTLDTELNEAYAMFEDGNLSSRYDVIYRGDINKWKKLNASIRMMMAIKLSDVDEATGKTRFLKAYNDGGIVANEDAMIRPYLQEDAAANPLYINIYVDGRVDYAPSSTLINNLLALKDPRVIAYATPNKAGDFNGWVWGHTNAQIPQDTEVFSEFAKRFKTQNASFCVISPTYILSLEAEAAYRGWIAADYKTLYEESIKKSFEYYDIKNLPTTGLSAATAGLLQANRTVSTYLEQDGVKLAGDKSVDDLHKIVMQRWLGNFMMDATQSWCDWRRFNYPELKVGDAGSVTLSVIPERLSQKTDDYEANMDNYKAAIQLQGEDKVTTRVWWDTTANH